MSIKTRVISNHTAWLKSRDVSLQHSVNFGKRQNSTILNDKRISQNDNSHQIVNNNDNDKTTENSLENFKKDKSVPPNGEEEWLESLKLSVKRSDMDAVENLRRKLERENRMTPAFFSEAFLIWPSAGRTHNYHIAMVWYDSMRRRHNYIPDLRTIDILINVAKKYGKRNWVVDFLNDISKYKYPSDSLLQGNIITACLHLDMEQEAVTLLNYSERQGYDMVQIYRMILQTYSSRMDKKKFNKYWKTMWAHTKGEPPTEIWNVGLSFYKRSGDVETFWKLWDQMHTIGVCSLFVFIHIHNIIIFVSLS